MRLISSRFIQAFSLLLLLPIAGLGQVAVTQPVNVALFPRTVGEFRLQGVPRPVVAPPLKGVAGEDFGVNGAAEATFVSPKGERVNVLVVSTDSQAGAYALLTEVSSEMRSASQTQATKPGEVGVSGIAAPGRIVFYKGPVLVSVSGSSKTGADGENALIAFARDYSKALPEVEDEIPPLVKHLPEWEQAQERAMYAVSMRGLERAAGRQPVFEVVNFDGGAEAVAADYGSARLTIIEYATPQLAADTDARITARLQELRAQGQPLPSSYRKVGNYSVFVFGAADEQAAEQLIDQVKYEQRIQWLGENPLAWARAEKQHTREAVGLILGIAKTIGFFVAICLGVGGVFGGFFYLRRKAQQRAVEATPSYSDAGGMLRLNLDEMTPETDPSRLLGAGKEKSAVP